MGESVTFPAGRCSRLKHDIPSGRATPDPGPPRRLASFMRALSGYGFFDGRPPGGGRPSGRRHRPGSVPEGVRELRPPAAPARPRAAGSRRSHATCLNTSSAIASAGAVHGAAARGQRRQRARRRIRAARRRAGRRRRRRPPRPGRGAAAPAGPATPAAGALSFRRAVVRGDRPAAQGSARQDQDRYFHAHAALAKVLGATATATSLGTP